MRNTSNSFSLIISRECNNNTIIDIFVAILLSLSPILQHYKGFYENAGATVLIICFPFLLLKLFIKRKISISQLLIVLPIIVFDFYKAIDHGMSFGSIAHALLIFVIYVAISNGCINFYYFLKACFIIAEIACVLIICQYICYYLLGFHLQLVSINMLLPECEQWFAGVKTGLVSITGRSNGYYRPSAFFLEPSHFFLFVIPQLVLTLLSEGIDKWKIKRAILFSIGLIFSTSGMAICFVVVIWALYLLFHSNYYDTYYFKKLFSVNSIILFVLGLCVMTAAYLKIPFVHLTVDRIIIGDKFGNTAISGRTYQANLLLAQIKGRNLWFGVTKSISDISFNLSGYAATMYKYGIIGVILSYIVYLRGVIQLKRHFRVVSIIVFITSFFSAHTHGTYHMIYFVIIIMEGFIERYYGPYNNT